MFGNIDETVKKFLAMARHELNKRDSREKFIQETTVKIYCAAIALNDKNEPGISAEDLAHDCFKDACSIADVLENKGVATWNIKQKE